MSNKSKKRGHKDKKKILKEEDRITVSPRLEGKAKNAKMNPIRKKKKKTV
jgi:hypothetical protein